MTPAVGTPASPWWGLKVGEEVARHQREWRDGRWSYLYREGYAADSADGVAEAARRARSGPAPEAIGEHMMKPPVWTWEIPVYFWTGGIASGSAFVALACDLAGDHRSAEVARKVSLAALVPCPPLLIMDLGRPGRFLNMLRIFKTRSPMSMGAWCLTVFGNLAFGGVVADLLGRRRLARALGGANSVVGGYLGSYTGVLLGATAVPLWARSRLFLGPIFVSTATATGAAACRLVLVARGLPSGHPTRNALAHVQAGAMTAELALSILNERRLGIYTEPLERNRAMKAAKWLVRLGLALQAARKRVGPWAGHAASVVYLAAGLLFRIAWVSAGPVSARDDRAVAEMARER